MQQFISDAPASNTAQDGHLADLLRAAADGNARAFETFYLATVRHAMAVVRRIAGSGLSEDILSDCYFQAWRDANRFDPLRGSALAWLLTIARSRALDRLRQESVRHGGHAATPEFDSDNGQPSDAPGPDELLESVESRTRLHAALTHLSASERWMLALAYFRDCSQAEIATLTGLPLGTVKSHINRAQHKLRAALQDESAQQ
jgi:RNA polymerase sigma-70 factor (ECF subfamily)